MGAGTDVSLRVYRLLLAVGALAGLWMTRFGLAATVPAGDDVEAHVARTDAAFQLFRHGRLDGWFPTFGSGYRLFAVYGPGLAIANGVVRLLSFGQLDTARAMGVLGALSIAAMPWAVATLSRELGSNRTAAVIHGVLALLVSFPFGGGLAGLYGPGLVPQAVAVPIQVAVLAGILRVVRTGAPRTVATTAVGIAALLLLHPISLLILLAVTPGLLLAHLWRARARHRLRERLANTARVGLAGLWGAAIAAFWLWPAWRTRDLRGGVSAWATPTLPTRLGDIWDGKTVYPRWLTLTLLVALTVTTVQAGRSRWARRRLVPPITAAVYLVIAHLAVGHDWGPKELRIQFANRGMALMALLMLVPLAGLIADGVTLAQRRVPLLDRRVATAALILLIGLAGPTTLHGRDLAPRQAAPAPTPDLVATARTIHRVVPPWARHLLAEPSPFVDLGTSEPTRWLAVASGRNTAQLYFPEATKNAAAGFLPGRFLAEQRAADALGPLRRAGITHVVVTAPVPADQLRHAPGYRLIVRHGTLAVYEVQPEPGAPPVATLLQPNDEPIRPIGFRLDATLTTHASEHLAWRVDASESSTVVMPVAFDPGWRVTVDGRDIETQRTIEGLTSFSLTDGRHRVEARFVDGGNDPVDITVTVLALAALAWGWVPSRLRTRLAERISRWRPSPSGPDRAGTPGAG